ncbi:MAG: hypothetical protein ACJA0E_002142 [Bermanella sp.]|jgi:hypothetical protein
MTHVSLNSRVIPWSFEERLYRLGAGVIVAFDNVGETNFG